MSRDRTPEQQVELGDDELGPTTQRPRVIAPDDFDGPTRVRPVTEELDPLIGATLGEYRVLAPLGAGGMGLVYRGEQPVIGRPVAIKVLKKEFTSDPAHARRFLEEARAVSAARHPGIVDIFSFGSLPTGEPYLVMELLEGQPLDQLLAEHGPLPAARVIELMLPMLSALSAAHAAGVIHRDLKPANVFVVSLRDGTTFPKLLDFGLARRGEAGQRLRQTSVGGTPLYIAPEQARGEAVGPQTDLYSLGCVIYELLIGRPPFTEGNLVALLDQHASLAPVPVRTLRAELPPALGRLVDELLAKDPADRPESALAVRKRLEAIAQEAAAPPPPRKARPRAAPARQARAPEPAATLPTHPVLTDEPRRPRAAFWGAAAVGALLLLAGVVALATASSSPAPVEPVPPRVERPKVAPIPSEPEAPEAVADPTPPALAPPPAQEPPPRPSPGPRHSRDDVQKRWLRLQARTAALPDDLRRAARRQLQEARPCTGSTERCWRELSDIEELFFGERP